jgi:hypothetical protein
MAQDRDGNELSGSIECWEILEWLLKKGLNSMKLIITLSGWIPKVWGPTTPPNRWEAMF